MSWDQRPTEALGQVVAPPRWSRRVVLASLTVGPAAVTATTIVAAHLLGLLGLLG
jgi:hypothetical protein